MSKSGTDIAYQYNADGLRTKKTVTQSGASTVYEYLWNESKLVGQKVGSDAVRILYDANDEPVGFTVNDTASYYYVKNLQGDVLAIVDKTGAEKVSYVYDAWGQIVTATGDAALQKLNPCTYRGYYYDAETGLYYLQSRYYNPEWGRFINADAAKVLLGTQGINGSSNLFAYSRNNPIMNCDATGHFAIAFAIGSGITISITLGQIFALVLSAFYIVSPSFRKQVNQAIVWLVTGASSVVKEAIKRVAKSVSDARKKPRTSKTHIHHIVAKSDKRAKDTRSILKKVSISVESNANKVKLNARFHAHLHTNLYHQGVKTIVNTGYRRAGKAGVSAALLIIKSTLNGLNRRYF